MSLLSEFFFATTRAVTLFQCLEITHPNFTTTYRIVRNAMGGVKAMHEDDTGPHVYQYLPMQIKMMGNGVDLDQALEVTIGDLGSILSTELTAVRNSNGMQTKPTLVYREYLSNNFAMVSGEPILQLVAYGPFTLQINAISFNRTGCVFTAKPPSFNKGKTGEVYDVARFPMLAGFL